MGNIIRRLGVIFSPRIGVNENSGVVKHHKCRNCGKVCNTSISTTGCANAIFTRTGANGVPAVIRQSVPDNKVAWSEEFDYKPVEFTSSKILNSNKAYVDPDPRIDNNAKIPWNQYDELYDRRSYHGKYEIVDHLPRNPLGRTGITGRGHLGHFGPNHAADPIVTRWKREANKSRSIHPRTSKPILQFVCIRRRDTGEFAIPGGMVDRQERVTETLQREFIEEALNFPEADEKTREKLISEVKDIFVKGGEPIYCGYVDDPRNTDNAWMETTVYNFHDEHDENLAFLRIRGGDDATYASWHDVDSEMPLYASHSNFLEKVARLRNAHW